MKTNNEFLNFYSKTKISHLINIKALSTPQYSDKTSSLLANINNKFEAYFNLETYPHLIRFFKKKGLIGSNKYFNSSYVSPKDLAYIPKKNIEKIFDSRSFISEFDIYHSDFETNLNTIFIEDRDSIYLIKRLVKHIKLYLSENSVRFICED